jgi:hypothetical protein
VAAVDPHAPPPEPDEAGVRLICLADVQPESVEWLWQDRIPIGKVSLLVGDPGLGKSFATLSIAATVSRGDPFADRPGEPTEPAATILLSAEDDPSDTIRPRLDAAGADVSRVFILTTVRQAHGHYTPFDLSSDIRRLEEALALVPGTRLIVIDPVTAYLGGSDENKNGDIRGLLTPLADLAAKHRVAILLITHMNKSTKMKAIYRATGTVAFVAAARTVWVVVGDAEEPERRFFLPLKNNLAKAPTGLAFRIEDGAVRWESEPVTITVEEALSWKGGKSKGSDDVARAGEWLARYLADGPRPSDECVERGNEALGLNKRLNWWRDSVLKGELGGTSRKEGYQGPWYWCLPGTPGKEAKGPTDEDGPLPPLFELEPFPRSFFDSTDEGADGSMSPADRPADSLESLTSLEAGGPPAAAEEAAG